MVLREFSHAAKAATGIWKRDLSTGVGEKQAKQHYGEELKESDEQKAQRLMNEMLRKMGWTEAE